MKTAIIVHGGAGAWTLRSAQLEEAVAACVQAAARAQAILNAQGSAMDAVEAAVRILEDCPVLDAGRGSVLDATGNIEMDALIMDGRTLDIGAVGAVQRVRHPISLARRVMLDTPHNLLVGPGAEAFADSIGFPRCELADLITLEETERFRALQAQNGRERTPESMGTVGAVALDSFGNLAAATSTGGTRFKLPGRLGDTPLIGSGGYADNWTAAASATGHGESLMKVVICKTVCDFVGMGLPAQAACDSAVRLLAERVDGHGGVIAIDARGQTGRAYNTAAMPHAFATGDGAIESGH